MSDEAPPVESQLILRSNCNSLIPVTATISQLKSSYKEEDSTIKSTAVDRSREDPVVFRSLQQNTNIALPPENWLKTSNKWEKLIKRFIHTHGNSSALEELTQSFQLANDAIDVLPFIDVVSNSENLKNLLKIPYDNNQILSLAVHRVGDTFLIDSFDAYAYLLDAQRADWQWIHKWFADNDGKRMALLLAASANRSRTRTIEKIKERDMLSKFLYHSIEENEYPASISPLPGPPLITSTNSSISPIDYVPVDPAVSVAPSLPKSNLQKAVMWSLEDMKILVGSDLPIFSTGSHPCFSLRLCDKARPISVITGLDCWLDNLMCNVPEVLMCYHIDGIVQQYEVFKTEDLPNLSDESRFSPRVVKDFATNILSFLRSNATKEGHTYWLLKEPDIDVVKLYDLTSLCKDFMDSVNDNPFGLPLAVLLCRLAYTILERPDSTYDQLNSVPRLLDSCIRLIDRSRYPWLYSVVNYLHFIATSKTSLIPAPCPNEGAESRELQNISNNPDDLASLEKKSLLNLEYIANGLMFLVAANDENSASANNVLTAPSARSVPVHWTADQQKAMITKLLRGGVCCYLHISALDFDALVARQGLMSKQSDGDEQSTRQCLCINIRRHLRLARNCLLALQAKMNNKEIEVGLKCAILQLIGDLHFVNEEYHANCVVDFKTSESKVQEAGDSLCHLSGVNSVINTACAMILQNQPSLSVDDHLASAYIGGPDGQALSWPKWPSPIERIECAIKIYEKAFEGSDDKAAVVRRMANACVEFANAIIARSLELFSEGGTGAVDEPLDLLWKKAYFAFDKAALLFESVRPIDVENLAIVESNRARLMRVCAYCQPKSSTHFLTEASRRYAFALKHLATSSQSSPQLIARIHWDLSSVYLALVDELMANGEDREDTDRTILKHLADASVESAASGLQEVRVREADICFREGKVRKRMLLRLVESNTDSKMCSNYMRLAEKSFEKCLGGYISLDRWEDWAIAHQELSELLLDPKLNSNSIFTHKAIAIRVSIEIRLIINALRKLLNTGSQCRSSITSETLSRICSVLSKLLSSAGEKRPALVNEVGDICKTLNVAGEIISRKEAGESDFSTLLEKVSDLAEKMKLS